MNFDSRQEKTNFSPDGRLLQIEYAIEAVHLGSTIIGIKNSSCAILILEKKKESKLIEDYGFQKLVRFQNKMGCGIAGLTSEARFLIEKMRNYLESNIFSTNKLPSLENCSKKIRELIATAFRQTKEESSTSRPPGVAFLLCGLDNKGVHLFQIDPSGDSIPKEIAALGGGFKESIFVAREAFRKRMSTDDTKELGLKIIRIIMERKINEKNLELGFIDSKKKKIFY
mmetsp:Transcript_48454/g.97046  ORF Transcript_48454/g.97046 Transcript_48454/m.97046 type:complete len:227 (-) Transcript_48454:1712-2392(-)